MSDSPNKSNASNALKALDCIDRRTAIEWVENIWIIETYYHPYAKRRIVSLDEVIDTLKRVPSAPQEIIRCKDCKYCEHWYRDKGRCFLWCETGIDVFEDGFCNYAGRRTDG